ncbi:hypothetical protein FOPG_12737 [Fusarium oxysporum f. sp. conglutinans race 2 54008]|uniref:Uncharacterized protein n=2 Tax=Fusarium oxysporum f. sp. conglutinans TaxID=100902 RepID=A0A8H6GTZ9_FUSOX|nr:hypothetical protein FOPG_12737 [Fusarium oxysporum f. sp. conglutinans race 2 54008]KAF6523290.1 hypothetical protein HZS61_011789 [Fusarium oxysporum f. sp. conglutinans]KAG6984617.1 hypothetical protein FocnCong_v004750 [Fusarium oxysporum f. sp. conglutinans]KAI8410769.1 hypothetical protein FOFC_10628 [Fusarium oxysporum]
MAAKNPDSLVGQGPYHARINPAQPAGNKWHKPGNEQGNDAAPGVPRRVLSTRDCTSREHIPPLSRQQLYYFSWIIL